MGIGFLWGSRRKKSEVDVSDFWAQKEQEFGEKKILSSYARYLGGHPRFSDRTDGLLFLMSRSLWFENFEKGPNIFGLNPPFEKVVFRIPLRRIISVNSVSEKNLAEAGFDPYLSSQRRINRRPEFLMVRHLNEWGREQDLFFDSMVDLAVWKEEIERAQANCPDEEEKQKEIGVCPQCGSKISPDFKLCPYCGNKLS
ncbi:MAG: hypothetical protein PWP04_1621 [Candidatus Atribacteria bacterium]|nr:hypothetical protein [Candidatus Atribacteria bacterium]